MRQEDSKPVHPARVAGQAGWIFTHNVTHNADAHRSPNSLHSHPSRPYVVQSKVHKHNILWLASHTKTSEFHLYYDI